MGEILSVYGNVVAAFIMIMFTIISGAFMNIFSRINQLERKTITREDLVRMRKDDYEKIDKRFDKLDNRMNAIGDRIDDALTKLIINQR